MLVLTRKPDEGILIGEDIRITILSIDGDRVRMGIDAPKSLRIYRMELLEQTKEANKEAAGAQLVPLNFLRISGNKDQQET